MINEFDGSKVEHMVQSLFYRHELPGLYRNIIEKIISNTVTKIGNENDDKYER